MTQVQIEVSEQEATTRAKVRKYETDHPDRTSAEIMVLNVFWAMHWASMSPEHVKNVAVAMNQLRDSEELTQQIYEALDTVRKGRFLRYGGSGENRRYEVRY